MHEAKMSGACCFLTLTYDDEHLPEDRSIHKKAVQNFFKRLRKSLNHKVRYFASGEYGEKYSRPHYHLALFGMPIDHSLFLARSYDPSKKGWWCYMKEWPYGHCFIGHLTVDSANYIAGYMVKKVKGKHAKKHYADLGIQPEFALMSRKPGIGSSYLEAYADFMHEHDFVVAKGVKYALPRYYRNKVFTDDELADKAEIKAFDDALKIHEEFERGVIDYESPVHLADKRNQQIKNIEFKRNMKVRSLND